MDADIDDVRAEMVAAINCNDREGVEIYEDGITVMESLRDGELERAYQIENVLIERSAGAALNGTHFDTR